MKNFLCTCMCLLCMTPFMHTNDKTDGKVHYISESVINGTIEVEATAEPLALVVEPVIEEPVEEGYILTEEEIELIALVTMAEAEGECEEGKRLVIDTILNRVDGEHWPDTVGEVIYQPNQFTSMWNGRVDRCEVREDICQLVREELEKRTNYDVVFFMAGGYSKYGTPLFQVEHHYFSKY